MSKIAVRAAMLATRSRPEKMILVVLVNHATREGISWPGVETIAEESEYHPREVRRALASLRAKGIIEPLDKEISRNGGPKGGAGNRTRYRLNLAGFAPEESPGNSQKNGISPLFRPETRGKTVGETRGKTVGERVGVTRVYPHSFSGELLDTATSPPTFSESEDQKVEDQKILEEEGYPLIPHDSLVGKEWLRTAAQSFQEEYPLPCPWGEIRDQWEAFCTDPEALAKLLAILRAWKVSEKWRKKDGQYIPGARNYFLKGYATKWPPDRSLPGETGGDRVSDATRATRRNLQDYTPGSAFAALLRRAQGGDGPVDGDLGDGDQRDYGRYLPPGPGGRLG